MVRVRSGLTADSARAKGEHAAASRQDNIRASSRVQDDLIKITTSSLWSKTLLCKWNIWLAEHFRIVASATPTITIIINPIMFN